MAAAFAELDAVRAASDVCFERHAACDLVERGDTHCCEWGCTKMTELGAVCCGGGRFFSGLCGTGSRYWKAQSGCLYWFVRRGNDG